MNTILTNRLNFSDFILSIRVADDMENSLTTPMSIVFDNWCEFKKKIENCFHLLYSICNLIKVGFEVVVIGPNVVHLVGQLLGRPLLSSFVFLHLLEQKSLLFVQLH